jgi:universal stress protein A
MLMPKKILVPTDFSEYSDKALKQALDIAAEYGSEVHVLHVVDGKLESTMTPDFSEMIINLKDIRGLERSLREMGELRLSEQLEKFPEAKNITVTHRVVNGIPYQEILREQEKKHADLIVIASLGQSGIAKYLIGGVARNVLKGATCPVLLTK